MSERGDVADWLGTGLQSPLIGFDSRRRLNLLLVPPMPGSLEFYSCVSSSMGMFVVPV